MTEFIIENVGVMGIFRHLRDAKFKIFSNYGGIMDTFVAFLAISEMQCGCTIGTLIKNQQCRQ